MGASSSVVVFLLATLALGYPVHPSTEVHNERALGKESDEVDSECDT